MLLICLLWIFCGTLAYAIALACCTPSIYDAPGGIWRDRLFYYRRLVAIAAGMLGPVGLFIVLLYGGRLEFKWW